MCACVKERQRRGACRMADEEEAPPLLQDLSAPLVQAAASLTGPPVSPQQRIFFYSSGEWELFVREWATGLERNYFQIKLLGGPGDRGVDIAGFKTARGFEDAWDCFQAKHYSEPLRLSDALPEMVKLLRHVCLGHYVLPDRYAFLAPKGCGANFNRLLSTPTDLKAAFLESVELSAEPADSQASIRALAEGVDFALFQSVEILDALEVHRGTPYHIGRFGGPLAPRPSAPPPPDEISPAEARYVAQLVEVYADSAVTDLEPAKLSSHPKVGGHFSRQRIAFYRAESLRLYARDSVPPGTFELLQDDVHAGVVEIAERAFPTGMERLSEVLTTSGGLDLSAHTLISVATMDDRKGICHQLANDDRLTWVRPGS